MLFAKLSNEDLIKFHKKEDVFIFRYFIFKTFRNILLLQEQNQQLPSKVSQLMLILAMENDDIIINIREQMNLLQQSYQNIINPPQELQQIYKSILNENK
jgi:hypothetical protein